MVGVRESARFNALMVLIKIGIVISSSCSACPMCISSNLHALHPAQSGTFGKFGVSGILAASGMIFFAYIGFEAVSVAAQEAKNPRRDLPIGILGSLGICTVLYILMAIVLLGITDWRTLDVPNPVSFAVGKIGQLSWLVPADQCRRGRRPRLGRLRFASTASRACSIRWRATAFCRRNLPRCTRVSTRPISARSSSASRGRFWAPHFAARHPGRSRLDRNAARLCGRVRRDHDPAPHDAQAARRRSARPLSGLPRRPASDLRPHDVQPVSTLTLGAAHRLDRHRSCRFFSPMASGTPRPRNGKSRTRRKKRQRANSLRSGILSGN